MKGKITGMLIAAGVILAAGAAADSNGAADSSAAGELPPFASLAGRPSGGSSDPALDSGARVYGIYCARCHGNEGGGDGFNAYNLSSNFGVSPVAFSDSLTWRDLDVEGARAAIKRGGTAVGKSRYMPPWEYTLSPLEVEDVLLYIRSMPSLFPE